MVLLGEEAQVEDRFSPFRDSGNIAARWVHGLRRTYHRLRNYFAHPVELLGDVGHVESCFGAFGDGVSIGARYVHGLNQMYRRVRNHFGRIRWYY